jgi:hypothetical protein
MQDTPEHIKQLQLDIWLSKSISERLERFILDNDALFKIWNQAKQQISSGNNTVADLLEFNLHKKI